MVNDKAVDRMLIELIANREGLKGVHREWIQKGPEEKDQEEVDGSR